MWLRLATFNLIHICVGCDVGCKVLLSTVGGNIATVIICGGIRRWVQLGGGSMSILFAFTLDPPSVPCIVGCVFRLRRWGCGQLLWMDLPGGWRFSVVRALFGCICGGHHRHRERGDRECWHAELAFMGSLYLVSRVGITAEVGVSI